LPIPAKEVDAVILTHAHLDHCGWIPRLVKEGFKGPIFATPSYNRLVRHHPARLRPPAGEDADFYNKIKKSKHDPALPLYTFEEAQDCMQYFRSRTWARPSASAQSFLSALCARAHILGSCMVEVTLTTNGQSAGCCSAADVGRRAEPHHCSRKGGALRTDRGRDRGSGVMESTYGNRQHSETDPRPELAGVIRQTVGRGGFHGRARIRVERTQKFVFMMKELMESGQIPRIPVYCDSPMAIKAVEIYMKYEDEYTDEARTLIKKYGSPLEWRGFTFASTADESKKINEVHDPSIIISSSGMVTAGASCITSRNACPTRRIR